MSDFSFRELYEQKWPAAECAIPDDAPKPWYVATSNGNALKAVMRSDYQARVTAKGFEVRNGEITRISAWYLLQGRRGGTLFILNLQEILPGDLRRMIDMARVCDMRVVDLPLPPRP